MNPGANPERGTDTARRSFEFVTRWDVPGAEAWPFVLDLLDAPDPFSWWSAVTTRAYDGSVVEVGVRSPLGYRLDVTVHSLVRGDHRLDFRASGHLRGRGVVEFRSDHLYVEWFVDPSMRWMTWRPLRPVLVAAHTFLMRRAERQFTRAMRGRG